MMGRKILLLLVVFTALLVNTARAGYWIPPIDYYTLNSLRFPLAHKSYDSDGSTHLLNLGIEPNTDYSRYWATAYDMSGVYDETRGWVASFDPAVQSNIDFAFLPAEDVDQASLSFWIKPKDVTKNSMIMTKAKPSDDPEYVSGFSLYIYDQHLFFASYSAISQLGNQYYIQSSTKLQSDRWHNVVITQSYTDAIKYSAMYIDGVLVGAATGEDISLTGMLDSNSISEALSTLGAASNQGFVFTPNTDWETYERSVTSNDLIIGVLNPFYEGRMSEFRFFSDFLMVCSDKTRFGYERANMEVAVGTRCDMSSDVASMAQDRIEQDGILGRLPLSSDYSDHQFSGLYAQNTIIGEALTAPTFAEDDLRIGKAQFGADNNDTYLTINYDPQKNRMATLGFTGPHQHSAISFWFQATDVESSYESPQIIYYLETARNSGGNSGPGLAITLQNGYITAVVWEWDGGPIREVQSYKRIVDQNWHHIALSIDPVPRGATNYQGLNTMGVVLYQDGHYVDSTLIDMLAKSSKDPDGEAKTTIGYDYESFQADRGLGEAISFIGNLSDFQVYDMPLSRPQARQLATRYSNAYKPVYDRVPYPVYSSNPSLSNGYYMVDQRATGPNPVSVKTSPYPDDSVEINFVVDWSKPLARWIDPVTHSESDDCYYGLGGVQYSAQSSWKSTAPSRVVLCFSPDEIQQGGAGPFSISLLYPNYNNGSLYLKVFDKLVPPKVWEAMAQGDFSAGLPGIKTNFTLNIGRYNTIIQAQTVAPQFYADSPNFVAPLFFGASELVSKIYDYNPDKPSTDSVTYISAGEAVGPIERPMYVDQRQLLDEFDVKLSKDR